MGELKSREFIIFLIFLTECAIIVNNAVSVVIGLGSMYGYIKPMLCQAAEHFFAYRYGEKDLCAKADSGPASVTRMDSMAIYYRNSPKDLHQAGLWC